MPTVSIEWSQQRANLMSHWWGWASGRERQPAWWSKPKMTHSIRPPTCGHIGRSSVRCVQSRDEKSETTGIIQWFMTSFISCPISLMVILKVLDFKQQSLSRFHGDYYCRAVDAVRRRRRGDAIVDFSPFHLRSTWARDPVLPFREPIRRSRYVHHHSLDLEPIKQFHCALRAR